MTTMSEDAVRPATPLDYHRLDSLRLQDAAIVPLPTFPSHHTTNGTSPSPDTSNTTSPSVEGKTDTTTPKSQTSRVSPPPTLPSTPQSKGLSAVQLQSETDIKRDSAIDNSTTNANCSSSPPTSPANLPPPQSKAIRKSTSLQSFRAQDAQQRPRSTRSSKGFLRRRFSKEVEPLSTPAEDESAGPTHRRLSSFHPIGMNITLESGLEDLNQPDRLKFSDRGSVMLNGRRLDAMFASQTSFTAPSNELDSIAASPPPQVVATPQLPSTPTRGTGLKTGRRTPSLHMLQSLMNGTRVLSAEENAFSLRVRTMYDYGDENAADWTSPVSTKPSPTVHEEDSLKREGTPDADTPTPDIRVPRRRPRSTSLDPARMSLIERGPLESAGGIEDWEALPPGSVDRYGFIKPTFSNDAGGRASPSVPESRVGMQRISTSLQLLSSNPRQPRRSMLRRPSFTTRRFSRSLPPSRAPSRQTSYSANTASSIYSYKSSQSSPRLRNPFRSRDKRTLDEAVDMLTLPTYLANIDESDKEADPQDDHLRRREWGREKKWQEMARKVTSDGGKGPKGAGMRFAFDVEDPKLVDRTWKGIPDRWRATAWHAFLTASAGKRGDYPRDSTLVAMFNDYQEQNSADDVQIDVDVPRTISMHIMFRRRYRGGQRLLFRVLHAISLHFPATGYVQGMAALAATLLCYYDEEMAFVMLVRMWQLRGLEDLYRSGFEGLMAALHEFSTEWLANDTEMSAKLEELGIDPTSYGTRWYLTLFNMSIPFAAQLRVWDVFMLLGDAKTASHSANTTPVGHFGGADLSVLHATSRAIVEAMRVVLMDSDFENGMKVLTSWVPVQDEDLLMRVARAEWKIGMRNRKREGRVMS